LFRVHNWRIFANNCNQIGREPFLLHIGRQPPVTLMRALDEALQRPSIGDAGA